MNGEDLEIGGHAPLAPSGAHRWIACPASVTAERGFPDQPSREADEGSAMHEVRARCLRLGVDPERYLGWPFLGGTRRAAIATAKRLAALVPGIDRIRDLCERKDGSVADNIVSLRQAEPRYVLIEEKLRFEDRALADVYGTLDFGAFLPWRAEVVVSDLKFGQGVPVYAEHNEQQLIYGALFLDSLTSAERRKIRDVRIIIDQPRIPDAGGEWVVTIEHVGRWIDEVLYPAVEATKSRTPKYGPGPKACYWCKARRACAAHTEYCVKTLGISFDDERDGRTFATSGIEEMSLERRVYLAQHHDMLDKFLTATSESVLRDALAGLPTPGLKAAYGNQGKRTWGDPDGAEEELVKLLDGDCFVTKLISPTEAADRLPRAKMDALNKFISREPAKPKLVSAESKKPAITPIAMPDERVSTRRSIGI